MGRRGGSSSRSSSPRRAPAPSRKSAPPPKPVQKTTAPQTQQSGGQSMAGNIASSMVGSFAGNYLARKMFGEGDEQVDDGNLNNNQKETIPDVCKIQYNNFMDCARERGDDISQCQFYFDTFNQCKLKNFEQ
eukprot:gene8373-198_t